MLAPMQRMGSSYTLHIAPPATQSKSVSLARPIGECLAEKPGVSLRNSKVIWNEQTLEQWLANPEKFIQGQRMGYSVSNAQERKDLIEFLKKQSKP